MYPLQTNLVKVCLNCFCRCSRVEDIRQQPCQKVFMCWQSCQTLWTDDQYLLWPLYASLHAQHTYSLHAAGNTAPPEPGAVSGPGYIFIHTTLPTGKYLDHFFSISHFLDPEVPKHNMDLTSFSCNSCSWKSFQRLWRWFSHFSSWGTKFSCHSSFRSSHSLTERPVTTGRVWRNSSVTNSAKAWEALEYSS